MWHYPQGADGHDRDPAVSYAAHRPQQAPHSSQKRAPLILLSTRGGGALIGRPPACRLLEVKGRRARRGEGGRQADSSEGDVYGELRAWWHPGAGAIELPRQRGAASLHRLNDARVARQHARVVAALPEHPKQPDHDQRVAQACAPHTQTHTHSQHGNRQVRVPCLAAPEGSMGWHNTHRHACMAVRRGIKTAVQRWLEAMQR
mmetsp:Transcript_16338/g.41540  ORF Transcript_16338/g.41540 Transcript_16338/m.41540 type:complete len:203 (-) Transcript_16338:217-825(-)